MLADKTISVALLDLTQLQNISNATTLTTTKPVNGISKDFYSFVTSEEYDALILRIIVTLRTFHQ